MSWEKDGEAIEEKKNTKLRFEGQLWPIRRIGVDELDLLPNIVYLQVWSIGIFALRRCNSKRNKVWNGINHSRGRNNPRKI